MTDQNANPKIQPLLATLLSRHSATITAENAPQVQVIIHLRSEAVAETVRHAIEQSGGEVVALHRVDLESRVSGEAINRIATLDSVVSIRLSRLPTPHG